MKQNNNKNFPQQTHFLGVLISEDITLTLEVMNELNLVEDFPVDNITIFERKGGKWETAWSGEL